MTTLTTEIKDHVLFIGLNRPDKMNAFNLTMLRELAAAYTQLEDNPDVRCALVHAHGANFTAGLDLAEVGPAVQRGEPLFSNELVDPVQVNGRKRTKPVVMAVKGYTLTIGLEMLLAADIAVAGADTRFGQIEIKRGIFPFGGATVRFIQRCGWGNAMRYLLTGDLFDAQEAWRIGLVQEVTAGDPLEAATQIAINIAKQAPLGVQATLASAWQTLEKGPVVALSEVEAVARKLMETADAAEGLRSFVERREARFTGK
ncbi:MAG: crotonase/enoyl-CoA hydratase family protein [Lewinellaceae bacterium]|nr:crotonase/enoyl-CoA hydratase family protein [Lewinellaceae bacterium]